MSKPDYRMNAFLSLGITFIIIGIAFAITSGLSWLALAFVGVALLASYHLRHREVTLGKRIKQVRTKRKQ
jgi:Flp pilus assembly protein TadB